MIAILSAFLLLLVSFLINVLINAGVWPAPIGWLGSFVEKIVEALFIAAILATTVDIFLKRQIAKDAFRASIGYILPDYLQDEMRAIYSNEIVCVDHSEDVKVELLRNSSTRMSITVRRTFKNISTNSHRFLPQIWVDEWFVENEPSSIGDCGYQVHGCERHGFETPTPIVDPVPKLHAEAEEVVLSPQAESDVWLSFSEIKRRTDFSYLAFDYATDKPRVRITVPEGFDSAVEFTHRLPTTKLAGETILPGLMLPHQCIIIRWWEQEPMNRWRDASRT